MSTNLAYFESKINDKWFIKIGHIVQSINLLDLIPLTGPSLLFQEFFWPKTI